MTKDRLMNQAQVAKCVGVSSATIRRWLNDESFPEPILRKGNKKYWSRQVIEELLRGDRLPELLAK